MTAVRGASLQDVFEPFFEACARGELQIPRCQACGRFFFYPTIVCQHCRSRDWSWAQASGRGAVYAFTVVYRPLSSALQAPYVVAVVELEEGVRLMTNVVECDPDDVTIDLPVEAVFAESWNGRPVPFFRPVRSD